MRVKHFYLILSDPPTHGLWNQINEIQDETLKRKALSLPHLIESAYAESTLKKYKPAWEKWLVWTKSFSEVNHCPAEPFHVAIYLNDVVSSIKTKGALTSAFLGIRWGHHTSGHSSPTEHPLVKLALEGGKRILSLNGTKNSCRKEPLPVDLLKQLVDHFSSTSDLVKIRFVVLILLGFSGFFRISELLCIKIKDLTFNELGVKVLASKSKTDQLREGNIVFISKTGTKYCPVSWLQTYLKMTKLINNPDAFLLCRLFKTKAGHNAHGLKPISYSTALTTFKVHVSAVSTNHKFSPHSLRLGGASEAADNDVSDRMISKHGRWSSNTSRDKYIKDKHCHRFEISRSLGI